MTPRPMVPVSTLAPNERFALEQFLCGDWEARTAGMTFTEIVSQIAEDESATPLQIRGPFANTPKYVAECVHRLYASLDLHTTPLVGFAKGIADLPRTAPYTAHTVKLAEEFALFSTLTDYPREKSFDEVVAELQERVKASSPFDEELAPFRQFEFYTATELIEHLHNVRTMALQQFGNCVDIAVALAQCAEDHPHTNETLQKFVASARIATGVEPSPEEIAEAEANAPKR